MVESARPVTYSVGSDESSSEAVLNAVSEATDSPILELDPLYDAVDPDALDTIFNAKASSRKVNVSFVYANCRVVVEREEVRVERPGCAPRR
jgi:hypothetical protein